MKRRDLLLGLSMVGGAALTGTLNAQERKAARIGFIGGGTPGDSAAALGGLRTGMKALGYVEPATLLIETRFATGDLGRIQQLIEDLEQDGTQVLFAHGQATLPAVKARRRLPLVFHLSADPVASGITATLARPDSNATGVTLLAAELNMKRMELLREIAPQLRRIAVLYAPQHPGEHMEREWVDRAAKAFDFEVSYFPAWTRSALDAALSAIRDRPPEALFLLSDGFMVTHRRDVMAVAEEKRIPVIAGWGLFVDTGAIASYGPRLSEMAQRPALYIDRILRGASPAELPIERPSILELVVNLDTAAKLGFNLPTGVIARADRVVG